MIYGPSSRASPHLLKKQRTLGHDVSSTCRPPPPSCSELISIHYYIKQYNIQQARASSSEFYTSCWRIFLFNFYEKRLLLCIHSPNQRHRARPGVHNNTSSRHVLLLLDVSYHPPLLPGPGPAAPHCLSLVVWLSPYTHIWSTHVRHVPYNTYAAPQRALSTAAPLLWTTHQTALSCSGYHHAEC